MTKIDGSLRSLFRQHLPQFDWVSIESGTTGGGIPDSNYCARVGGFGPLTGPGVEGWIEYKQASGWAVTLRPEQVGWISRRVRYGGRVWIAVRQMAPPGPRTAPRDALWLIPGGLAKEAKLGGLRALERPEVYRFLGGPSRWDWGMVAAALVS